MTIKTLTKLAAAVAITGLMASAQATSVTLGKVVPGSPADLDTEVGYVNTLVDLANGIDLATSVNDIAGHTYTLITDPSETLSYVSAVGALDVESWSSAITITGFKYVLAKYGNDTFVFYSADGSGVDLASKGPNDKGLSHYTAFTGGTTRVPDGGATVALLGAGLLGLGMMRRKVS